MGRRKEQPEHEDIRLHMERILCSIGFVKSANQSRLLRYLVEKTLSGESSHLKERVIGVEVWGKPADYNTSVDSTVRTETSKLRIRLARYYESSDDPVRIALPARGYVPQFHWQMERRNRPLPNLVTWRTFAVGTALGALLIGGYLVGRTTGPVIGEPAWALIRSDGFDGHPVLSRDGRVLAFASDRGPGRELGIWIKPKDAEPYRLTDSTSLESHPDISPSGEFVAFRSRRDGGGIWTAPIGGGIPRRLVKDGFSPRYSPDGKWIAFASEGIHVIPSGGGEPIRVDKGVREAGFPIWSPDGKYLVYSARVGEAPFDWWISRFDANSATPSPAVSAGFRRTIEGIPGVELNGTPSPTDWSGDRILFALGGAWAARILVPELRISGTPECLFRGGGTQHPRFDARGRDVVYMVRRLDAEVLAIERKTGQARLLMPGVSVLPTTEGTLTSWSRDGRFFAYASSQHSSQRIWLLSASGERRAVAAEDGFSDDRPLLAASGDTVVFNRVSSSRRDVPVQTIMAADPAGRQRLLCGECGRVLALTPGGGVLWKSKHALMELDLATGRSRSLVGAETIEADAAEFSPDGQWLALSGKRSGGQRSEGFVIPMAGGTPRLSDRIPIAAEQFHIELRWDSNGDALYFIRTLRGDRALWRQALHPSTKRPISDPTPLYRFTGFSRFPTHGGNLSAGGGHLAVTVQTERSEIWRIRAR